MNYSYSKLASPVAFLTLPLSRPIYVSVSLQYSVRCGDVSGRGLLYRDVRSDPRDAGSGRQTEDDCDGPPQVTHSDILNVI